MPIWWLETQGKPYTVRYEAVNAMLLNEFLKEQRKVEEQSRNSECQDRHQEQKRDEALTAVERAGSANPKSERTA